MKRSSTLVHAAAVFASLAAVFVPGAVCAQQAAPDLDGLRRTLASVVTAPPGNSVAGVMVVDVNTGAEVYASNADTPLNPASNAKVVTAACALKKLGPEFTFVTSLHGRREGGTVKGAIYLKGHADPTLATADLWEMARELEAAGIKRVEGSVTIDDTYFDGQNMPFAFDQQPDEDNKFRSPVGAASLNQNAIALTIRPGETAMVKARVAADPPGYAVLQNDTLTMGQGAHNPRISAVPFEDRTRVRVWGQVPLGSRPVTYYRRIDNPSLFTGYGLKAILEAAGISVGGDVRVGALPPGTPLLAEHRSLPLSSVLWETGKMSNNYVTETIFKVMGADGGAGPGTWEASMEAAAGILERWGIPRGTYTFRNGSGLFDANRFSARHLVQVLRSAYLDAEIRPEFVTQLATGGVDGTIGSRYRDKATRRHVRAKTGTLDDVSTLSGYVFDAEGRNPIAFSILVNKASGYVSAARGFQEKIVTAIAQHLNP